MIILLSDLVTIIGSPIGLQLCATKISNSKSPEITTPEHPLEKVFPLTNNAFSPGLLPPEARAPIIFAFGNAKSNPSSTYSVLIEKGSGNKIIVLGSSSKASTDSFQESGDSSGLGKISCVK